MDAVIRGLSIYIFLLVVFRIAGQRNLTETTTFDFVLLLIIGGATQQALLGDDFSLINAFIVIVTILLFDMLLSWLKRKNPSADKWLEGRPLILINDGILLKQRMDECNIDEEDILQAARKAHGLEELGQIKYAVLEVNGGISIIPKR